MGSLINLMVEKLPDLHGDTYIHKSSPGKLLTEKCYMVNIITIVIGKSNNFTESIPILIEK